MSTLAWLFITSVARIPSIVTSTVGGGALGGENYGFAVAAFAVTLVISGVGLLIYRRICVVHARREAEKEEDGRDG